MKFIRISILKASREAYVKILNNEHLSRTEDNEMHYRMKQKGYKFLLSPNIKTYRYARNDLKGMIKQKYGNEIIK